MRHLFSFVMLAVLLLGLVLLLVKHFPGSLDSDRAKLSLIASVVIITAMLARISISHINIAILLKQIGGWLVIALLILTGYSYQLEIKQYSNRLAANVLPGYGQGNGDGSVTYYAGDDGHFMVTGLLNDIDRVRFMLDTGASTVSLTKEDAERIGIDTESLNYNTPLNTANGISWGARVTIAKIQVGPIIVTNVAATVSQSGLDTSLLGMSFLRQLKQFLIKGNTLTLVN